MSAAYDSSAIEVLTGLEPVRRRPGMYTQTERPNHLAQEVVDNSVDEAIAGHCSAIDVTLHADGSLSVADNGRGMPVDKHKEEGVSGVEVILTRLHAGGKFSNKNYTYSGGLHGVGVSVVNALSHKLEVTVRRDGKEYHMSYADGQKTSELKVVGKADKKVTGSIIRFWPDAQFFDTVKFHVPRLKHVLRAKAVLCPGLYISFTHEADAKDNEEWHYEDGLKDYLKTQIEGWEYLPAEPFVGHHKGDDGEVDWAIVWLPAGGEPIMESYVNLIPTTQDGTHINGFRAGLTDAMREFCEFRDLLPRGVKLAPEDIWGKSSYVFSLKMRDPQFSGQTKERLTSREAAGLVQGVAKDSFSLWLNHHVADAEKIAALAIESRAGATARRQKGSAQEDRHWPGPARQARGLRGAGPVAHRAVPGGGRFRRRLGQAGARPRLPGHHAAARQDFEHLGSGIGRGTGLTGGARHCRGAGGRSGLQQPGRTALRQGLHPRRRRFRRRAYRDTVCAPCSCAISGRWWRTVVYASPCRRCTASTWARKFITRWTMKRSGRCSSASKPMAHAPSRWSRASRAWAR